MKLSSSEYGGLTCLITRELGDGYMIGKEDLEWLDVVSTFFDNEKCIETKTVTGKMVTDAFVKAQEKHGCDIHIDPFELCIDAGFCDSKLVPTDKKFSYA